MARKPESELPVLPSEKPPLPQGHVQCAAADTCRRPGRLPFEGYSGLICVIHYYDALEQSRKAPNNQ